MSLPVEQ